MRYHDAGQNDDPFEPSHLDLSSDPPQLPTSSTPQSSQQKRASHSRQAKVKLYFGCCRTFAILAPPAHVLAGEADIWRAHCPRCGGLVEILFE